ncbi:hypothetical protein [Phenylobacterium sp.]|jgi:hypothetical protein|uniref:hypothetical protein n=1 Tax=Phenylobacterium sp. TaxID=1871053 RepID=UPI002F423BB6
MQLPWLAGFVLCVFGATFAILGARADAGWRVPRDLTPDLSVDAGPYRTPAGCPARRWSPGEYMPHACLREDTVIRAPRNIGLEPPQPPARHPSRYWVRDGNDALAVICGVWRCKVAVVVRDRFVGSFPIDGATDGDGVDYRREPLGYALTLPGALRALPALAFCVVSGLRLWRGGDRDRRSVARARSKA